MQTKWIAETRAEGGESIITLHDSEMEASERAVEWVVALDEDLGIVTCTTYEADPSRLAAQDDPRGEADR